MPRCWRVSRRNAASLTGRRQRTPDRVAQLEERVRELGISGVPTFIFDRRSGISGAYPPAELAAAIRAAAAR
jgi:predicted DsbA family dithiol-disulfide isomerase